MITTKQLTLRISIITCMVLLLTGCGHEHQWTDATCTEPKTCSECGNTEGEPLGHDWVDATCTEPKTCKVCGATEGEPLGHVFEDATCTEAKKCKRCGGVQGEPLGHSVTEWRTITEPTCTESGTRVGICSRCGRAVNETTEATGHKPSEDWEIVEEATFSTSGKRVKTCTVCGEEVESESYEMTKDEKDDFRPAIEEDHFNCTVDDFIENFKYKNHGVFTFTRFQSDDQSQTYILKAESKLTCTILCSKTDEGKLKAILVNSDDYSGTVAVGILMANTIDDYFTPEDKETSDEIAEQLILGKAVEHDGLVVAPYDSSSGKCIIITSNN